MSEAQPHVLVIDDDKRLRDLIARYLTEQGYRVTAAVDAADARAKLTGITFDLLVVDVMMPTINGDKLARMLRKCTVGATLGIVLVSSRSRTELEELAATAQVDDVVSKADVRRTLVSAVQRAVVRRAVNRRRAGFSSS